VKIGNRITAGLLRSPLHRVLSGSVDLVRYTGHRSGRTFTTPTQYAHTPDGYEILVGRADTKTWWRNFTEPRELDLLVQGQWHHLVGQAVVGAEDPGRAAELLEAYLRRFPRAGRILPGNDLTEQAAAAVLVHCRADDG
jgi:hypothetical protein